MDRCKDIFSSPDILNYILKLMSLRILRDFVQQISRKWFNIMVDKTNDLSNTEQMVLCLRNVDDDLNVYTQIIDLYSLESTSGENILLITQDIPFFA